MMGKYMSISKKKYILFVIIILYLISWLILGRNNYIVTDIFNAVDTAFSFIVLSCFLIGIHYMFNSIFPLKYLAYKNTYKIILFIFIISFVTGIIVTMRDIIFYHSTLNLINGYKNPNIFIDFFILIFNIYYHYFLFYLYVLYSIKNYNKFYGTFLIYNKNYCYIFHIIFILLYWVIMFCMLIIIAGTIYLFDM